MSDLVEHVGDGKARTAQRLTRARPGTAIGVSQARMPGAERPRFLTVSPCGGRRLQSRYKQVAIALGAADAAAPVEPDRKCMGCLGITNERGLP